MRRAASGCCGSAHSVRLTRSPSCSAAAARRCSPSRVPQTTQELAARLQASAGGVSEHLGVLRRAGLIAGRRDGRSVIYERTRTGDDLAGV